MKGKIINMLKKMNKIWIIKDKYNHKRTGKINYNNK